jgi:CBS domain-containing protein
MNSIEETPWILEKDSLMVALDAISNSNERTVFVISPEYRLEGVISEGDIVRAYRRGQIPSTPARDIMTSVPIYVSDELDSVELCGLFVKTGVLLIPIVNSTGVLVGSQSSRLAVQSLLAKQVR